ncbi:MAG: AAA family ATPase [Syntrophorhabdales bacterium]|jgi:chromosome segregation protein
MKLTSLELLGFKSFLNRTTFRFDEGVTCIVGPNGCGKSNIVDAVSWVLGERGTKSLRVKEMGDVIFHGSTAKKQVNMAEVTMGLTNDGGEYAVRRRIYRDGTNEYYINGNPVRLKDIQDFFLGTGIGLYSYAIIEQGNIEYFAQMRPQERRVVVEETSGITRFEEKKRDAFSRMEEVKTNLERVEDIQGEVKKAYAKAEEEAGRLKVYNGLKGELRTIDIALLLDGFARLWRRAAKIEERGEEILKEAEGSGKRRQALSERMAAKDDEISAADATTRQLEVDIKGKEKDMESRLLELNYLDGEEKRLDAAMKELRREIEELSRETGAHLASIESLKEAAAREREDLERLEGQGRQLEAERDELGRAREKGEREAEEERNGLFAVMTRLTEVRNSVMERQRLEKEREARRARRLEEERLLGERLRLLEAKSSAIEARKEEEREAKALAEAEEKALSDRVDLLAGESTRLRNDIEGLKGVRRGKEEVFKQMKSLGAGRKKETVPFKQLINILKASKENEEVTERFFAREMDYHVLPGDEPEGLSRAALEHAVNFIFFPRKGMFALEAGEANVRLHRVASPAEAFQRIEQGEEGLFLAGEVLVDSRGLVRVGQDGAGVSIREFREKIKLETELTHIDEELRTKTAKLGELQVSQKELNSARAASGEKRRSRESALAALEREYIDVGVQVRTVKERLSGEGSPDEPAQEDENEAFFAELAAAAASCEEEKVRIEQLLVDLKGRLEKTKEAYALTDGEFHTTSIAIERLRNQLKKEEEEEARKRAAKEASEKERAVKEEKMREAASGLEATVEKAHALEEGYGLLKEEHKRAVTRYEEMTARLGDLHVEKASLHEDLRSCDQEIERIRAKKEALEKEGLILQEKMDAIREKLKNDYGIEDVEGQPAVKVKDEGERERILQELAAMGEVNFRAEKEREELKERLDFLETQKSDLVQAMESLKKTISKIDSVSRELFLETFEKVNDAFRRFTGILFKGGHGTLMLNQETSGIDLYVQPPGKKVIRMELLSGGEKALISLAFLLSLMETKASPFTLMDEIDAPLDDANLLSLLDIVKTIAKRTQTIIITHNRLTMESSNTIYGITMEEDGISKTISVQL